VSWRESCEGSGGCLAKQQFDEKASIARLGETEFCGKME